MEERDSDENFDSFPLSTWGQDYGLRALSSASLQDAPQ